MLDKSLEVWYNRELGAPEGKRANENYLIILLL